MMIRSIFVAMTLIFLPFGQTSANAHIGANRASSPTDHEHYHCHYAQQCHSHGHDGAHH